MDRRKVASGFGACGSSFLGLNKDAIYKQVIVNASIIELEVGKDISRDLLRDVNCRDVKHTALSFASHTLE